MTERIAITLKLTITLKLMREKSARRKIARNLHPDKIRSFAWPSHLLAAAFTILLSACSDSDTTPESDSAETDADMPMLIQGTISDQLNGEPILGAMVGTEPPSEESTTELDGLYAINTSATGTETIQIIVSHTAYDSAQSEVSTATGSDTQLDIAMTSSAAGLHASSTDILFADDVDTMSLQLSSNVRNTGYSVLTSDPWVEVTPSEGVITNRETIDLQLQVVREALPSNLPAQSLVTINADNGTRELVIPIVFEPNLPVLNQDTF